MDKQAFIAAVKAAGIVGEGGAGFPAHVKYAADADTVIANGCECEPLLHTDQHHMLHHANEIVRAFSELMQATGAKRGVIALKKKYKEATKILTDAIGNRPIELALLPNFYPAGDEQTLVREVTGRSVRWACPSWWARWSPTSARSCPWPTPLTASPSRTNF